MQKIYLKINDKHTRYYGIDYARVWDDGLAYVSMYLQGRARISAQYNYSYSFEDGYEVEKYDDYNIRFYSHEDIKDSLPYSAFPDDQDALDYLAQYQKYAQKRDQEITQVIMTIKNHDELCEKWLLIKMRKPRYIILSQDDSGYVDIEGKDEFSQEDMQDIKVAHENFLRNQAAWFKYNEANPNRSTVWRSPADDEFEADWQKYLD